MRVVVEVVFIVTDEFELAVKVSFADDVVLQVPKSTTNDPAPTKDPLELYAPVANVWVLAKCLRPKKSQFHHFQ